MSDGMNEEFLKDPVKFAKNHILLPGGVEGHAKMHDQDNNFYSVPSEERVVFCDILKPGRNPNGAPGVYAVQFDRKKQSGWFPAFWLPWEGDHIYKCTLKDRRWFGSEAKMFFTAALDGCSVIVEGEVKTPSVYHANAMNYNPNDLEEGGSELRQTRMDHMREDLFRNTKVPKRGVGKGARGVEGQHYMADFLKPADPKVLKAKLDFVLQRQGSTRYKGEVSRVHTVLGKQTMNLGEIRYNHGGTVFGVKGGDGWKFYYQRRVTAEIFQPTNTNNLQDYDSWKMRSIPLPTQVAEFWPSGGGVAVSRVK